MDKNKQFLNNKQKKAIENIKGSLLILAGAGSGKTKVLTTKVYHLLNNKLALPNQILAVTFTNKAANEMKLRVSKMINQPVESWWVGTFHSLSAKILRRNAQQVGLKNNFVIIDQEDQFKLIKNICKIEKINLEDNSPKYFLNLINRYKNEIISFEDINKKFKTIKEKNIEKIYSIYENELIRLNCCDFGNLLSHCLYIFRKNKNILQQYQSQFKYILVDEYQDINFVQQEWLKLLYGFHKNICCVGDDDQSIYSWRGAEIKNILNFERDFENSSIIRLEQNYRSTQRILKCASQLISKNKGRYGKTLWSNNNTGNKIQIKGYWEVKDEANEISKKIESFIKEKISLDEIAILMRVAAHTRSFEERFLNIGLPYRIVGGIKFYERKEIKDVISYLRVTNNTSDNLAFERIINVPKRGIGQITINNISIISRKNKVSMFEASKMFLNSKNSGRSKNELNDLISKIYKWKKLKKELNHIELCELILDDSGYLKFLNTESNNKEKIENYDRYDNVMEFLNSLKEFENLEGFLDHVSLVSENENIYQKDKINLMTIHSSKGLEFDYVFLIGWEEGLFPSKRSIEENGNLGLEEERRLAYVALTRARKNAFISYVSQNRYSFAAHEINIPSRFISELPEEELEIYNSEIFQYQNQEFNVDEIKNKDFDQLTPGRKRLLEYNKISEISDWDLNQDSDKSKKYEFNEGDRIFHNKFGYGRILEMDGDTSLINFEKTGTKMVFLKYLIKE